ncbi:MAG: family ATPase [Clostridia bacterium]|jgi:SpoVK/Ycf46/Vps4 family AAA+-type ATPase|nr:family ATPase [Clostridia bacterium]
MEKIDLIKKMLESDPENAEMWCLLGMEYAAAGRVNDSMLAFSEALKTCNDDMKLKISQELVKLTASMGKMQNESNVDRGSYISLAPEEENDKEQDSEQQDSDHKIVPFDVIQGGRVEKGSDFETAPTIAFEDVGGLEELKETIRMKIIKPFVNQGLFDKFKKKVGGGLLLYGPPGCGKTFMAKATAGECKANFKPVHITDILDKYIGESEQNVRNIFATARARKPCILFFDEIDSIGFNRAKLSSEHLRPVIDQLLTEIEGIDSNTDKLLIIGATNMPWDVDPAFKRPGRFDKMIFVPPPDKKARAVIFKLKLQEKPITEMDFELLANKTELYSGADIENVVEAATENVISEIMKTGFEREINMKDMLTAIDNTRPSTIEWLKTVKNYVKYANQSGLYNDVENFLSKNKSI